MFSDYDCNSYPGTGTEITLQLVLLGVRGTKSADSELYLKAALRHEWIDTRLAWDPSSYEGTTQISAHTNSLLETQCIWTPDVQLINNVLGETDLNMAGANVFSDGKVFHSKMGNMRVMMIFDLTQFRFDRQTFEIKMQSWSYSTREINITLNEQPLLIIIGSGYILYPIGIQLLWKHRVERRGTLGRVGGERIQRRDIPYGNL